jgi:hypothetical protein
MKKIVCKKCCECGCKVSLVENEGMRCELCTKENWIEWLETLGWSTGDYSDYDGRGFRKGDREKHENKLSKEKKELKKLRVQYPERAAAYKKKNPNGTNGVGTHYVKL